MQSIFILGRQPALGLAELESLYGADRLRQAGDQAALLDIEPSEVDFARLGGSTKYGRVLTVLDTTDWKHIQKYLVDTAPEQAGALPEGKLTIGISTYGLRTSTQAIQAVGLTLKKVIRKSGRPVRLVPNKELELNTAQILHNGLTGPNGWELLLVRDGDQTIIAQTIAIQDIESATPSATANVLSAMPASACCRRNWRRSSSTWRYQMQTLNMAVSYSTRFAAPASSCKKHRS